MTLALIGSVLGGVGLFLLGMWLMTDGLKLAAGRALKTILARSTRTPVRGLLSGALVTGLVQSSSAVTVATIGFVNAGLLNLAQAATVVYGANIGTTMTGWLVALVGLHLNVKALALPLVGVGMLLRLTGAGRRAALGQALVGFGIFFLGIDVLKTAFEGFGDQLSLDALPMQGPGGVLTALAIGFLLTLLMQSSSAAIAVILTAAAGGVLSLHIAAAMVVGANVGTTSTAMLAVIGATPNAKRVAGAHVAFNLITGAVALLLLQVLLAALIRTRQWAGLDAEPAVVLALFHSIFNVLGVALMLPLNRWLVTWLSRRFCSAEEDESRPRYLDHNVAVTPTLALEALVKELQRVGGLAQRLARHTLQSHGYSQQSWQAQRAVIDRLVVAVGEFVARTQQRELSPESADTLPAALQIARRYSEAAELAAELGERGGQLEPLNAGPLQARIERLRRRGWELLQGDPVLSATDSASRQEYEQQYHSLKSELLRAGAQAEVPVAAMVQWLDVLSDQRRMMRQLFKAQGELAGLYRRTLGSARFQLAGPVGETT